MLSMSKPRKPTYYRTTRAIDGKLKGLVGSLQAAEPLVSREKRLTQEALINAAILWMASMDARTLAPQLAPHVEAVEAEWAKEGEGAHKATHDDREYNLDHVPPPPLEGEAPRDQKRPKRKRAPGRRN